MLGILAFTRTGDWHEVCADPAAAQWSCPLTGRNAAAALCALKTWRYGDAMNSVLPPPVSQNSKRDCRREKYSRHALEI